MVSKSGKKKRTPDFFDSRSGQTVLAVVLFPVAYLWGSWAINSGSYWHYLLALITFVWGVRSLFRAIKGYAKN